MGGVGSGRRLQFGAETTEDYHALDVRWLNRVGILSTRVRRQITWSKGDTTTGTIHVQSTQGQVILDYCYRDRNGEDHPKRYAVPLTMTDCHLGGSRYWFRCPAEGCGRRAAILYGGGVFACRHCHGLTYASRREKPWDRALRRAHRIRDKLEWPGGIAHGRFSTKPKGMHQRTFERLCNEHDALADQAIGGFTAHFASE